MTLRLRAHHMLCVLTYQGKGYSPSFVENFNAIIKRLRAGEDVLIVEGSDDICAPLVAAACETESACHCLNTSVAERDHKAVQALAAALGPLPENLTFNAAMLAKLRRQFANGSLRAACTHCEWFDLCSRTAADGFRSARLQTGREEV